MNMATGSNRVFTATAEENISAGEIVIRGKLVGVAVYGIAAGGTGAVERFREVISKYDGAAEAAQGATAYYNQTTKTITASASGAIEIGLFSVGAAKGDATASVFLN